MGKKRCLKQLLCVVEKNNSHLVIFFRIFSEQKLDCALWELVPGDLVTLITLNTPEAVIAFYAIDRIGAVANWVDTKLSPTEVEEYLIRAQSKVVLVLELAFAKVYQNRGQAPAEHFITLPLACYLPDALGEKLHLNTWQESAGPGCMPWVSLLQTPQDIFPEKERWEEPVAITYTGGTTGPAKGVMLSRRAFRASLEQYAQAETEYGRGGENLDLLPLFSAFGLCQCVHVPLCLGMGVILSPLFRPNQLGQASAAIPSNASQRNHLLLAVAPARRMGKNSGSFLLGKCLAVAATHCRRNWNGASMLSWRKADVRPIL
ncbi:MAG: AMP-binding protein [Oscillospiraceae bacterium]